MAAAKAELDSINIVEGLVIKDGPQVEVLNVVSLHGGLVGSWPVEAPVTSARTLAALVEHWREVGLPDYAQFDNDMIFQGTHRYADALGRVIRLCLSLAVVPVFVPPREMGFQATISKWNFVATRFLVISRRTTSRSPPSRRRRVRTLPPPHAP